MSAASFNLTLEYGGLTQLRTHGDCKIILYAEPYISALAMANFGQVPPGKKMVCNFALVDEETGEVTE